MTRAHGEGGDKNNKNKPKPKLAIDTKDGLNPEGFLCGVSGCGFLSKDLDNKEKEAHFAQRHPDRKIQDLSFISLNSDEVKAMCIIENINQIKKEHF